MSTESRKDFDTIVIGAGSGGLTVAVGLAGAGKKVLLIEKSDLGGECTNSGCIPSKALLSYSKQHLHDKKISDTPLDYTQKIIQTVRDHESIETLTTLGITIEIGEAEFIDKRTIAVNNITYQFKKAVIATGSKARKTTIPGVDESDILTNEHFFTHTKLPKDLVIIGGGPIGIELAEACHALGSTVTIIEKNSSILSTQETSVKEELANQLQNKGITIHTLCTDVSGEDNILTFTSEGNIQHIPYEKILLAIGRIPNLPTGLQNAGIATDNGHIIADTHHKTTNGAVFAIGDVTLTKKYTHTAEAGARSVVAHILTKGLLRSVKNTTVPHVLYTSPELASVGLTKEEAIAAFGADNIHVLDIEISTLDRAITENKLNGKAVIIVRRLSGKILGAHILMPHAGELISYFSVAIDNKLSLYRLAKTIYPYPTFSQIITKAADTFLKAQRITLKKDLTSRLTHAAPYLIIASVWVLLVALVWYWFNKSDTSEIETLISLLATIASTFWGPIIFILIYSLRPLVLFPATWLTILAGSFFGFWLGLGLTLIGATGSALVAYSVARWFNRNYSPQDIQSVSSWKNLLKKHTFEATLFLRLSFIPFDPISYLAGALKLPPMQFIIASLIGILPGSAAFVALGASVDLKHLLREGVSLSVINLSYIFISIGIFFASLFISYLARKRQARITKKKPL